MTKDLAAPVARSTDPATSHEAAQSIDSDAVTKSQAAVAQVLRMYGPMPDQELIKMYNRSLTEFKLPMQSESGIRTRRKELVKAGVVALAGDTTLPTGRRAQTWRVIRRIVGGGR